MNILKHILVKMRNWNKNIEEANKVIQPFPGQNTKQLSIRISASLDAAITLKLYGSSRTKSAYIRNLLENDLNSV